MGFPGDSVVKPKQETSVQSLGQEDPLEKEKATHSSTCLENSIDRGDCWAVHGVEKESENSKGGLAIRQQYKHPDSAMTFPSVSSKCDKCSFMLFPEIIRMIK